MEDCGPLLTVAGWLLVGVVVVFVICALTVSKRVEEETEKARAKQDRQKQSENVARYR